MFDENFYKDLIHNSTSCYANFKIINENNTPIDFQCIESNKSFIDFLNIKSDNISNKHLKNLINFKNNEINLKWFNFFMRFTSKKRKKQFKFYFYPLKKWIKGILISYQIDHFAVIFNDITEEKLLIEKISKEENKYNEYFIKSPEAILIANRNGKYVDANPAACRLLKYTRNQIVNRNIADIVSEKNVDKALLAFNENIKKGYAKVNLSVKKSNNEEIIISLNASTLSNGLLIAFCKDITKEVEYLEEIKKNKRLLDSLIDNARDSIIVINEDGNIMFWNSESENLFGYKKEEVIGKYLHSLITTKEDYENHKIPFKNFTKTGKGSAIDKIIEMKAVKKSGEIFPVELSVSGLKNENNWWAIGIIRDITQRKIEENKLKKAKKEAEIANYSKSMFLANMSHEIRTPMNGIIGFLDLIKSTELNSEQKEYIKIISESSDSLLKIINEILDLSKFETGEFNLNIEQIDIQELIKSTINLNLYKINEKKLKFISNIDKNLPKYLFGDSVKIKQIINNILNNAIKFTNEGVIILTAKFMKNINTFVEIYFEIKDTGIGIKEEQMPFILDNFNQGDSSTTRRFSGLGLGLTISKNLIELMDGELNIESEINKGTKVSFTLKLNNII